MEDLLVELARKNYPELGQRTDGEVMQLYRDGKIDIQKLNPIGRLAGNWYTRPTDNFRIERKIKPKQ